MDKRKTNRFFDRIDFVDRYGIECSLQKSSLATEDAVWFGCNDANPKILVHGKGWQPVNLPNDCVMTTRMHLTREMVKELLPHLINFVEIGDI